MKSLKHTIKESLRIGINKCIPAMSESLRIGINDKPQESDNMTFQEFQDYLTEIDMVIIAPELDESSAYIYSEDAKECEESPIGVVPYVEINLDLSKYADYTTVRKWKFYDEDNINQSFIYTQKYDKRVGDVVDKEVVLNKDTMFDTIDDEWYIFTEYNADLFKKLLK